MSSNPGFDIDAACAILHPLLLAYPIARKATSPEAHDQCISPPSRSALTSKPLPVVKRQDSVKLAPNSNPRAICSSSGQSSKKAARHSSASNTKEHLKKISIASEPRATSPSYCLDQWNSEDDVFITAASEPGLVWSPPSRLRSAVAAPSRKPLQSLPDKANASHPAALSKASRKDPVLNRTEEIAPDSYLKALLSTNQDSIDSSFKAITDNSQISDPQVTSYREIIRKKDEQISKQEQLVNRLLEAVQQNNPTNHMRSFALQVASPIHQTIESDHMNVDEPDELHEYYVDDDVDDDVNPQHPPKRQKSNQDVQRRPSKLAPLRSRL